MALSLRRGSSNQNAPAPAYSPGVTFAISDQEFDLFRRLIHDQTGIHLADHKRELVVSRLAKRLRTLNLKTFGDYYQYLTEHSDGQAEMGQMINRITTNKTDFYREAHHFEFLREAVLPELVEERSRLKEKKIRGWSSASSTGEEPYTIAITLAEFFADKPGWDVKLLASDLDTEVLAHASRGVYLEDRVEPVPKGLLRKYFSRVPGLTPPAYQVSPALREMLTFRRFNLLSPVFPFKMPLDFIFCRNVMIYFNQEDKIDLLKKFNQVLKPKGYIFVGHSESLMMVKDLFKYIKSTVYQKL